MAEKKEQGVQLRLPGLGYNDQVPYVKIDIAKACQVNNDYAFSFYQFDYSAIANALGGNSGLKAEEIKLMPVAKIVMNEVGFKQFLGELKELVEKLGTQDSLGAQDSTK